MMRPQPPPPPKTQPPPCTSSAHTTGDCGGCYPLHTIACNSTYWLWRSWHPGAKRLHAPCGQSSTTVVATVGLAARNGPPAGGSAGAGTDTAGAAAAAAAAAVVAGAATAAAAGAGRGGRMKRGWTTASAMAGNEQQRTYGDVLSFSVFLISLNQRFSCIFASGSSPAGLSHDKGTATEAGSGTQFHKACPGGAPFRATRVACRKTPRGPSSNLLKSLGETHCRVSNGTGALPESGGHRQRHSSLAQTRLRPPFSDARHTNIGSSVTTTIKLPHVCYSMQLQHATRACNCSM